MSQYEILLLITFGTPTFIGVGFAAAWWFVHRESLRYAANPLHRARFDAQMRQIELDEIERRARKVVTR